MTKRAERRIRLGWLGPVIALVGVAGAGAAVYAIVTGRPEPDAIVDQITVDARRSLVVRDERGGDRSFVELYERRDQGEPELVWRALIPPYAGRPGAPGIAWGHDAVTVRVIRGERAEIFGLAQANAAKLGGFKLAPGKGPVVKQATGPVTLSDGDRAYEIVAGVGWNQLVAIDLATGEGLWKRDLDGGPIASGNVDATAHAISLVQGERALRFDTRTGKDI